LNSIETYLFCPNSLDCHKKALRFWFHLYETEKYKKLASQFYDESIDPAKLEDYEGLTYEKAVELFEAVDKLSVYDEDHIRSISCIIIMKDLKLNYQFNPPKYNLAENPCYFHQCAVSGSAVFISQLCVKYDSSVEGLDNCANSIESYLMHIFNDMLEASTKMHKTYHYLGGLFVIAQGMAQALADDIEN